MDARFVFERIASQFRELNIELFNCSDGAMIPGWLPLSPEKAQSVHIANEKLLKTKFLSWWKTCTSYSQEMLISRWNSADPRGSIFRSLQLLSDLLNSADKPLGSVFGTVFMKFINNRAKAILQFALVSLGATSSK